MALITFTSHMHKDKTVYAVAGSNRQTVLSLAKEHHIPIDFGCENGDCGTCLVKVSSVDTKRSPMGKPLTDHEVRVLKEMGHISQAEIDKMYVDDLCPTQWRLACQMVLRDEDILVEYPSK
jgi:ferredoxin